jgi:CHAT domain-containing protein
MGFVLAVVFLFLQGAKAQTKTSPQPQHQLMVETLERGMLAARPIPTSSLPAFDDTQAHEDQRRFDALYQEYFAAAQKQWNLPDRTDPQFGPKYSALMQQFSANLTTELSKYFRQRIDAAAAQYGTHDPHYISALEDAGIELRMRDPDAGSFLDKAIQLREAEDPKSLAYWKDLNRRCISEQMEVSRPHNLAICEHALEVRESQPDATPLELATRQQSVADLERIAGNEQKSAEHQQKAADLYAKSGAVLPMAGRFRDLTTLALPSHDGKRIVALNDLTNRYLSMGDAKARDLALPSETLRLLEEERLAPDPPSMASGAELSTADQILDRWLQVDRALKTGRLTRPVVFDFPTVLQAVGSLGDRPAMCDPSRSGNGGGEMIEALMRSQLGLDEKLARASSTLFAYTSILESVCSASTNDEPAPGYSTIVHMKGRFTEMVSPRKITVLPGYGKERTQAIQSVDRGIWNASLSVLPPDVQERIKSLPPDEQAQALKDYSAAHPDSVDRGKEAMKAAFSHLQDALKTHSTDSSELNALGFLDLLRPGETFVDIYKYRSRQGAQFGAEQYLAVVGTQDRPPHSILMGPAAPIDSAIDTFLSSFGGGRSRGAPSETRGIRVDGGNNDSVEARKNLERLVIRPLLAALPGGTKRIFLSPDSSLALVPYASLLLDMKSPILASIMPSAYDFARLRGAPPPTGQSRALVVGALDYGKGQGAFSPLPGTEAELKVVARQASSAKLQTETLSGGEATRQAVIDRLSHVQLVHLATHGFWSSAQSATVADALRSAGVALSLANAEGPDSRLTAEDMFHLDLSGVQLVVLSACTTGQGRPVDGQGLLGFQTAFMAAGAQSLLLSLWNVPDEATSALMEHFYRALFATPGISKSEALRQAQRELSADSAFADPRNWAAWVVVGDAQ